VLQPAEAAATKTARRSFARILVLRRPLNLIRRVLTVKPLVHRSIGVTPARRDLDLLDAQVIGVADPNLARFVAADYDPTL
jgi:hypothetical protein